MRQYLPFARWLDYCEIALLVTEETAVRSFGVVMQQLTLVDNAEAAAKQAKLRAVQEAFVFRNGSTLTRPSAAEYIFAEACEAARRIQGRAAPFSAAGGSHRRCLLGPGHRGDAMVALEPLRSRLNRARRSAFVAGNGSFCALASMPADCVSEQP